VLEGRRERRRFGQNMERGVLEGRRERRRIGQNMERGVLEGRRERRRVGHNMERGVLEGRRERRRVGQNMERGVLEGRREREGELDRILIENNIKISVITESKKKLQGTQETEHCMAIDSGVDRHSRGQSGVAIWIHKSTSNKIDHYKFWNDRVIEARLKTERRHLITLAVYGLTEGRDGLNEEFYETLLKILDKVNRNDCIMLIGDMNVKSWI